MSKSRQAQRQLHPYEIAIRELKSHYLLGPIASEIYFYKRSQGAEFEWTARAYCRISGDSTVFYNDEIVLPETAWRGIFALATLVFALGGPKKLQVPAATSDFAAQLAALYWWRSIRVGTLPEHIELPSEILQWGRLPLVEISARIKDEAPESIVDGCWTLTRSSSVFLMNPGPPNPRWRHRLGSPVKDFEQLFAQSMVDNAKRALQTEHEASHPASGLSNPNSNAARAKRWLIAHYPLLGSLLTQFDLIEDIEICRRMDIHVAAIYVATGEIYINPARGLSLEAAKFVVAHEVLHAGLCHGSRRQGRDPYLWNVACDFVINDWLLEMGVGIPPDLGLLFDEELRGWAAEDIYLRLAADLRIRRRLMTMRGQDCDILDDSHGGFLTDREEFYRRALLQGLDYHQASGRGKLPGGLVESIRTLNQPPIPWQARLAEWFQEQFPLQELRRTYARPSRRQSVTPDNPRPRHVQPEEMRKVHTFGVIIDTSGSMDRADLGKALGAVVSYSQAQSVRQVRLVYCDALPYDEGFVTVESLAARVAVRGRGGTVLQPAVTLLETRRDFPKESPILIITDGLCEDELVVGRDHAFLITPGARLPFRTQKPVFKMA